MRHEDALLVLRLAQHNAPALAMEPYCLDGEQGLTYSDGQQRCYSGDLPALLRVVAEAISRLQPELYCPGCGKTKAREDFYNYFRGDPSRKQRICKECSKRQRREFHRKNPEANRRNSKRYQLQGHLVWTPEMAQRNMERQRAARLGLRVARAHLLIRLCAEEYGLQPEQVRGRPPISASGKRGPAAAFAARLIRWHTNLHPAAIAELLECTEADVTQRIAEARRWTHSQHGDVRLRDAMQRITRRYVEQRAHLEVPKQEYSSFTDAQRRPGRGFGDKEQEEDHASSYSSGA